MDEKAMTRAERAFVTGQQIEEKFGGCAQCVLRSLILNGCDIPKEVFRSASGLAAGVGRQGETCGAVTGAVLALSALYGREFDRFDETEARDKTFGLCYRFMDKFRAEYGSIQCCDIQKDKYGRKFEMYDPEEFRAFLAAGGHDPGGCPSVVGNAATFVVEILEEEGYFQE